MASINSITYNTATDVLTYEFTGTINLQPGTDSLVGTISITGGPVSWSFSMNYEEAGFQTGNTNVVLTNTGGNSTLVINNLSTTVHWGGAPFWANSGICMTFSGVTAVDIDDGTTCVTYTTGAVAPPNESPFIVGPNDFNYTANHAISEEFRVADSDTDDTITLTLTALTVGAPTLTATAGTRVGINRPYTITGNAGGTTGAFEYLVRAHDSTDTDSETFTLTVDTDAPVNLTVTSITIDPDASTNAMQIRFPTEAQATQFSTWFNCGWSNLNPVRWQMFANGNRRAGMFTIDDREYYMERPQSGASGSQGPAVLQSTVSGNVVSMSFAGTMNNVGQTVYINGVAQPTRAVSDAGRLSAFWIDTDTSNTGNHFDLYRYGPGDTRCGVTFPSTPTDTENLVIYGDTDVTGEDDSDTDPVDISTYGFYNRPATWPVGAFDWDLQRVGDAAELTINGFAGNYPNGGGRNAYAFVLHDAETVAASSRRLFIYLPSNSTRFAYDAASQTTRITLRRGSGHVAGDLTALSDYYLSPITDSDYETLITGATNLTNVDTMVTTAGTYRLGNNPRSPSAFITNASFSQGVQQGTIPSWRVIGEDSEKFQMSSTGTLQWIGGNRDTDTDYDITIWYGLDSDTDTLDVSVTITDVAPNVPPSLNSAVFNLSNNTITLTFNEALDFTHGDGGIDLTKVIVRSTDTETGGVRLDTDSSATRGNADNQIIITMSGATRAEIDLDVNLASFFGNTWIHLDSEAVVDDDGQPDANEYQSVSPIEFITDFSQPTLSEAILNYQTKQIILTFDKAIDSDIPFGSFGGHTNITNPNSGTGADVTLSATPVWSNFQRTATFALTDSEITSLEAQMSTTVANTYFWSVPITIFSFSGSISTNAANTELYFDLNADANVPEYDANAAARTFFEGAEDAFLNNWNVPSGTTLSFYDFMSIDVATFDATAANPTVSISGNRVTIGGLDSVTVNSSTFTDQGGLEIHDGNYNYSRGIGAFTDSGYRSFNNSTLSLDSDSAVQFDEVILAAANRLPVWETVSDYRVDISNSAIALTQTASDSDAETVNVGIVSNSVNFLGKPNALPSISVSRTGTLTTATISSTPGFPVATPRAEGNYTFTMRAYGSTETVTMTPNISGDYFDFTSTDTDRAFDIATVFRDSINGRSGLTTGNSEHNNIRVGTAPNSAAGGNWAFVNSGTVTANAPVAISGGYRVSVSGAGGLESVNTTATAVTLSASGNDWLSVQGGPVGDRAYHIGPYLGSGVDTEFTIAVAAPIAVEGLTATYAPGSDVDTDISFSGGISGNTYTATIGTGTLVSGDNTVDAPLLEISNTGNITTLESITASISYDTSAVSTATWDGALRTFISTVTLEVHGTTAEAERFEEVLNEVLSLTHASGNTEWANLLFRNSSGGQLLELKYVHSAGQEYTGSSPRVYTLPDTDFVSRSGTTITLGAPASGRLWGVQGYSNHDAGDVLNNLLDIASVVSEDKVTPVNDISRTFGTQTPTPSEETCWSYPVTISQTGNSDDTDFILCVNGPNRAPEWLLAPRTVTENIAISFNQTFADSDAPAVADVSVTILDSDGGPVLTVGTVTRSGISYTVPFTGTAPDVAADTDFTYTLRVSDGTDTDIATFTLTIDHTPVATLNLASNSIAAPGSTPVTRTPITGNTSLATAVTLVDSDTEDRTNVLYLLRNVDTDRDGNPALSIGNTFVQRTGQTLDVFTVNTSTAGVLRTATNANLGYDSEYCATVISYAGLTKNAFDVRDRNIGNDNASRFAIGNLIEDYDANTASGSGASFPSNWVGQSISMNGANNTNNRFNQLVTAGYDVFGFTWGGWPNQGIAVVRLTGIGTAPGTIGTVAEVLFSTDRIGAPGYRLQNGDWRLEFFGNSGEQAQASQRVCIRTEEQPNAVPQWRNVTNQTVDEDSEISFSFEVVDSDDSVFTFVIDSEAGSPVLTPTVTGTGPTYTVTFTGTAPSVSADTDYVYTIKVNDSEDTDIATFTLTVETGNNVPVVSINDQTVTEGASISFTANIVDSDTETFTIDILDSDGGPVLSTEVTGTGPNYTLTFTGTAPLVDSDTVYNYHIRVTDSEGATDTETFTLTVNAIRVEAHDTETLLGSYAGVQTVRALAGSNQFNDVEWYLSGTDSDNFNINISTGEITQNSPLHTPVRSHSVTVSARSQPTALAGTTVSIPATISGNSASNRPWGPAGQVTGSPCPPDYPTGSIISNPVFIIRGTYTGTNVSLASGSQRAANIADWPNATIGVRLDSYSRNTGSSSLTWASGSTRRFLEFEINGGNIIVEIDPSGYPQGFGSFNSTNSYRTARIIRVVSNTSGLTTIGDCDTLTPVRYSDTLAPGSLLDDTDINIDVLFNNRAPRITTLPDLTTVEQGDIRIDGVVTDSDSETLNLEIINHDSGPTLAFVDSELSGDALTYPFTLTGTAPNIANGTQTYNYTVRVTDRNSEVDSDDFTITVFSVDISAHDTEVDQGGAGTAVEGTTVTRGDGLAGVEEFIGGYSVSDTTNFEIDGNGDITLAGTNNAGAHSVTVNVHGKAVDTDVTWNPNVTGHATYGDYTRLGSATRTFWRTIWPDAGFPGGSTLTETPPGGATVAASRNSNNDFSNGSTWAYHFRPDTGDTTRLPQNIFNLPPTHTSSSVYTIDMTMGYASPVFRFEITNVNDEAVADGTLQHFWDYVRVTHRDGVPYSGTIPHSWGGSSTTVPVISVRDFVSAQVPGDVLDSEIVTITIIAANNTPTLSVDQPLPVAEGAEFSVSATVLDSDSDTIAVSITSSDANAPTLNFDSDVSSPGVEAYPISISGIAPLVDAYTTYTYEIRVEDSRGGTDSEEFTLAVYPFAVSAHDTDIAYGGTGTEVQTVVSNRVDSDGSLGVLATGVTYTLSGTDSDSFAIDDDGVLTVNSDSIAGNQTYTITVEARTGAGALNNPIEITTSTLRAAQGPHGTANSIYRTSNAAPAYRTFSASSSAQRRWAITDSISWPGGALQTYSAVSNLEDFVGKTLVFVQDPGDFGGVLSSFPFWRSNVTHVTVEFVGHDATATFEVDYTNAAGHNNASVGGINITKLTSATGTFGFDIDAANIRFTQYITNDDLTIGTIVDDTEIDITLGQQVMIDVDTDINIPVRDVNGNLLYYASAMVGIANYGRQAIPSQSDGQGAGLPTGNHNSMVMSSNIAANWTYSVVDTEVFAGNVIPFSYGFGTDPNGGMFYFRNGLFNSVNLLNDSDANMFYRGAPFWAGRVDSDGNITVTPVAGDPDLNARAAIVTVRAEEPGNDGNFDTVDFRITQYQTPSISVLHQTDSDAHIVDVIRGTALSVGSVESKHTLPNNASNDASPVTFRMHGDTDHFRFTHAQNSTDVTITVDGDTEVAVEYLGTGVNDTEYSIWFTARNVTSYNAITTGGYNNTFAMLGDFPPGDSEQFTTARIIARVATNHIPVIVVTEETFNEGSAFTADYEVADTDSESITLEILGGSRYRQAEEVTFTASAGLAYSLKQFTLTFNASMGNFLAANTYYRVQDTTTGNWLRFDSAAASYLTDGTVSSYVIPVVNAEFSLGFEFDTELNSGGLSGALLPAASMRMYRDVIADPTAFGPILDTEVISRPGGLFDLRLTGNMPYIEHDTDYVYSLRVTDSRLDTDRADVTITNRNAPPRFVDSETTVTVEEGSDINFKMLLKGGSRPFRPATATPLNGGPALNPGYLAENDRHDLTNGDPAVKAPGVSADTEYRYLMHIEDVNRDTDTAIFILRVTQNAPTLADTEVSVDERATATGHITVSNGNSPFSYSVGNSSPANGPTVSINANGDISVDAGSIDIGHDTEYTYTVTVTDTDGDTATATLTVNVRNINRPPRIAISTDTDVFKIDQGQRLLNAAVAELTDSDGDTVLFRIEGSPYLDSDLTNGILTVTSDPINVPGTYTYTIYARDSISGEEESDTFTITVLNVAPAFDSEVADIYTSQGDSVSRVLPEATDVDTDLTYSIVSLPPGFSFNANTRVLSANNITAPRASYGIVYRVTDPYGGVDTDNFFIHITNSHPMLTISSTQSTPLSVPEKTFETDYTIGTVVDSDDTNITITILEVRDATNNIITDYPALTFRTAALSGDTRSVIANVTTGSVTADVNYSYLLEATDSFNDTDTGTFYLRVTNNPPVLDSETRSVQELADISIAYAANLTGGNAPFTWSIAGGLSIDSDGLITGTAPDSDGMYSYVITVTDSDGDQDTATLTLNVTDVVPSLEDTEITVNEGDTFSARVEATGGHAPYTYSITDPATHPDVTISSGGTITGTAPHYHHDTEFAYQVLVTDSTGHQHTFPGHFVLNILNVPHTVTDTDVTVDERASGTGHMTVTGGFTPYSFEVGASSPANGPSVTIAANGDISVDATSTEVDSDTAFTYTVTVTDSDSDTATGTLTVTVRHVNRAPVFDESSYSFTIDQGDSLSESNFGTVTDSDGDLQYPGGVVAAVNGANALPGFTFSTDSNGNMSVSSGPALTAGTFLYNITATDNAGDTATATLTVTVVASVAPSWTTVPATTDAEFGDSFSITVTATDADSDDLTLTISDSDGDPALTVVHSRTGTLNTWVLSGIAPTLSGDSELSWTLNATDPFSNSTGDTEIVLSVTSGNRAPTIEDQAFGPFQEDTEFEFQLVFDDLDSDRVRFEVSAAAGSPVGSPTLTIDTDGLVTGTAPSVSADTNFLYDVKIIDQTVDSDTDTARITLTIGNNTINWVNFPFNFFNVFTETWVRNISASTTLPAVNSRFFDTDELTYTFLEGLTGNTPVANFPPAGITFDSVTRTFSGVSTDSDINYGIDRVRVSDPAGNHAFIYAGFRLINDVPTFVTTPGNPLIGVVGGDSEYRVRGATNETITFVTYVEDSDSDLTFAVVGSSANAPTLSLSGNYTWNLGIARQEWTVSPTGFIQDTEVHTYTIHVEDALGDSDNQTVRLTVQPIPYIEGDSDVTFLEQDGETVDVGQYNAYGFSEVYAGNGIPSGPNTGGSIRFEYIEDFTHITNQYIFGQIHDSGQQGALVSLINGRPITSDRTLRFETNTGQVATVTADPAATHWYAGAENSLHQNRRVFIGATRPGAFETITGSGTLANIGGFYEMSRIVVSGVEVYRYSSPNRTVDWTLGGDSDHFYLNDYTDTNTVTIVYDGNLTGDSDYVDYDLTLTARSDQFTTYTLPVDVRVTFANRGPEFVTVPATVSVDTDAGGSFSFDVTVLDSDTQNLTVTVDQPAGAASLTVTEGSTVNGVTTFTLSGSAIATNGESFTYSLHASDTVDTDLAQVTVTFADNSVPVITPPTGTFLIRDGVAETLGTYTSNEPVTWTAGASLAQYGFELIDTDSESVVLRYTGTDLPANYPNPVPLSFTATDANGLVTTINASVSVTPQFPGPATFDTDAVPTQQITNRQITYTGLNFSNVETINITSPIPLFTADVANNTLTVDTTGVALGDYEVTIHVTNQDDQVGETSYTFTFTVLTSDIPAPMPNLDTDTVNADSDFSIRVDNVGANSTITIHGPDSEYFMYDTETNSVVRDTDNPIPLHLNRVNITIRERDENGNTGSDSETIEIRHDEGLYPASRYGDTLHAVHYANTASGWLFLYFTEDPRPITPANILINNVQASTIATLDTDRGNMGAVTESRFGSEFWVTGLYFADTEDRSNVSVQIVGSDNDPVSASNAWVVNSVNPSTGILDFDTESEAKGFVEYIRNNSNVGEVGNVYLWPNNGDSDSDYYVLVPTGGSSTVRRLRNLVRYGSTFTIQDSAGNTVTSFGPSDSETPLTIFAADIGNETFRPGSAFQGPIDFGEIDPLGDTESPQLVRAAYSRANGVLTLNFNEPIYSIHVPSLSLQPHPNTHLGNRQLTAPTVEFNGNRTQIRLVLTASDKAIIDSDTDLFSNRDNAFISWFNTFAQDESGNAIVARAPTNALRVNIGRRGRVYASFGLHNSGASAATWNGISIPAGEVKYAVAELIEGFVIEADQNGLINLTVADLTTTTALPSNVAITGPVNISR